VPPPGTPHPEATASRHPSGFKAPRPLSVGLDVGRRVEPNARARNHSTVLFVKKSGEADRREQAAEGSHHEDGPEGCARKTVSERRRAQTGPGGGERSAPAVLLEGAANQVVDLLLIS